MPEIRPAVDPLSAVPPNHLSAVLLAGGKSSRMGFDKATLVVDGLPLWRRQIELLEKLPARAVFISGPRGGPWKESAYAVIEDETPFLGPMGALVSILRQVETRHVLVLAVDMPKMEASFLQKLVTQNCAVVPRSGNFYEPLAAIYSVEALPLLEECLARGERRLQSFLREAVELGIMAEVEIHSEETPFFANLNTLGNPETSPQTLPDF